MEERASIPAAGWLAAGTVFLVQVVWTNLTGLGIGQHPLTYDTVALPRLVVAVVGVLAAWALVFWRMRRDGAKLRVDVTLAVLAALASWAVISALASAQGPLVWLGQSERLEGVVTIVLYAVVFGLGLQLGRDPGMLRVLSWSVIAGTALLAAHGALQALGVDPTDYAVLNPGFGLKQAFASLDNPNFLAGHLVLALPLVLAVALRERRHASGYVAFAVLALSVVALATTASEGAWLAVLAECAVGLAMWLRRKRGARDGSYARRRRLAVIGVLLLACILGATVIAGSSGAAVNRLGETATARLLLSKVAVDAAAERPLVGYGPDAYLAAFRRHHTAGYTELFGNWSTNNNAHSWIMQFLATLGFPGALLLAAALTAGILRSRPPRRDDDETLLRAAVSVALLGYALQVMINVAMIASTVPFWMLMGVACSARAKDADVPRAAASAMAGLATLAACVMLVAGVRLLDADAAYFRSRLAYNGDAAGDPVALADEAARLNPLSVKYLRGAAQARSRLAMAAIQDADAADATVRGLCGDAATSFERVLSASPDDYAALAWYSALQASAGERLDDAELRSSSVRLAVRADGLDSDPWQVSSLAAGKRSSDAIEAAMSVPGTP